jgi:hypothetical protein
MFLNEAAASEFPLRAIGFPDREPFMNLDFAARLADTLRRAFRNPWHAGGYD